MKYWFGLAIVLGGLLVSCGGDEAVSDDQYVSSARQTEEARIFLSAYPLASASVDRSGALAVDFRSGTQPPARLRVFLGVATMQETGFFLECDGIVIDRDESAQLARSVQACSDSLVVMPQPGPPVTPVGTPVPTESPSDKDKQATAQNWAEFSSEKHAFRFRYPDRCGVTELDGSFHVGRIELDILESKGLNLSDFVKSFVEDRSGPDWAPDSSARTTLAGGYDAITVEFRFGGQRRYGTATFVKRGERIYVWSFTAGGFTCDEPDIYREMLGSFRFT